MRHIKSYKSNNEILQIGDYVICKELFLARSQTDEDEICENFLKNNIGKYVKKQEGLYLIKYENVPPKIKDYFDHDDDIENKISNVRRMNKPEIIAHSKNKEYLEVTISQNKFNL